jgi:hypothetical protein
MYMHKHNKQVPMSLDYPFVPLTFISKFKESNLSLSVIVQMDFGTVLAVCIFHFINLFIKIAVT